MAIDWGQVLRERARQLAAKTSAEERGQGEPALLFKRHGELFGVRLNEARGSGRLRELSPIPGGPTWLAGVIQHQGEVLSLIDLPVFWEEDPRSVRDLPTYLVLSNGTTQLGVLVEELLGVHPLDGAPSKYQGAQRLGITEVGRYDGQPVLLLSARTIFDEARFQA